MQFQGSHINLRDFVKEAQGIQPAAPAPAAAAISPPVASTIPSAAPIVPTPQPIVPGEGRFFYNATQPKPNPVTDTDKEYNKNLAYFQQAYDPTSHAINPSPKGGFTNYADDKIRAGVWNKLTDKLKGSSNYTKPEYSDIRDIVSNKKPLNFDVLAKHQQDLTPEQRQELQSFGLNFSSAAYPETISATAAFDPISAMALSTHNAVMAGGVANQGATDLASANNKPNPTGQGTDWTGMLGKVAPWLIGGAGLYGAYKLFSGDDKEKQNPWDMVPSSERGYDRGYVQGYAPHAMAKNAGMLMQSLQSPMRMANALTQRRTEGDAKAVTDHTTAKNHIKNFLKQKYGLH